MAVIAKSLDWIRGIMLGWLGSRPEWAAANSASGSRWWRIVDAFAREVRKVEVDLTKWTNDNVPPDRSSGQLLADQCTCYGVAPAEATAWKGRVTVYASGTATPEADTGLELTSEDGIRFRTTRPIYTYDWVGGSFTSEAESITLGTSANLDDNTPLTVVSPPAGMLTAAIIEDTNTTPDGHATDAEGEDSERKRLRNRLRGIPGGGNVAQYRDWVLRAAAEAGVGREDTPGEAGDCFVYPRFGSAVGAGGTVYVVPVRTGTDDTSLGRIVGTDALAAIQTYLDARDPPVATVTVEPITPVAGLVMSLSLNVLPKEGYEADWLYPVAGRFVLASTPATRTVQLDDTPPMIAGDRVVVYCGGTNHAEEEIVESVGPLDTIVLREWPEAGNPTVGTPVVPGGPLWAPVIAAIKGVFAALGPSGVTDPLSPRWPWVEHEAPSTLYLSSLYAAIMALPGVSACTITGLGAWDATPGSLVAPVNITNDVILADPIHIIMMAHDHVISWV